jgi:anti-sigma regulatory factor (Ser/Thr protein kinase)
MALSAKRLYEAELLVSEVVTNALRYGQAPVALAVDCTAHYVLVRVRNRGAGRPRVIDPDPTDEHGRGLLLLDVMSDKWGVQGDRAETVVWFTLERMSGAPGQVGVGTAAP